MKSKRTYFIQNDRTGKYFGRFAKEETALKYANKMYDRSIAGKSRSMKHSDGLVIYYIDSRGNIKEVMTCHE